MFSANNRLRRPVDAYRDIVLGLIIIFGYMLTDPAHYGLFKLPRYRTVPESYLVVATADCGRSPGRAMVQSLKSKLRQNRSDCLSQRIVCFSVFGTPAQTFRLRRFTES
jgi:hypothetical protein